MLFQKKLEVYIEVIENIKKEIKFVINGHILRKGYLYTVYSLQVDLRWEWFLSLKLIYTWNLHNIDSSGRHGPVTDTFWIFLCSPLHSPHTISSYGPSACCKLCCRVDISTIYGLLRLLSEINCSLCLFYDRLLNIGVKWWAEKEDPALILRDKNNPSTFTTDVIADWEHFTGNISTWHWMHLTSYPQEWEKYIAKQQNICKVHCQ